MLWYVVWPCPQSGYDLPDRQKHAGFTRPHASTDVAQTRAHSARDQGGEPEGQTATDTRGNGECEEGPGCAVGERMGRETTNTLVL